MHVPACRLSTVQAQLEVSHCVHCLVHILEMRKEPYSGSRKVWDSYARLEFLVRLPPLVGNTASTTPSLTTTLCSLLTELVTAIHPAPFHSASHILQLAHDSLLG